jgi:hypothetical protein
MRPKAPRRTQKHLKAPQCATSFKQSKQSAPFCDAFWRFSAFCHHNQKRHTPQFLPTIMVKSGRFLHKDIF